MQSAALETALQLLEQAETVFKKVVFETGDEEGAAEFLAGVRIGKQAIRDRKVALGIGAADRAGVQFAVEDDTADRAGIQFAVAMLDGRTLAVSSTERTTGAVKAAIEAQEGFRAFRQHLFQAGEDELADLEELNAAEGALYLLLDQEVRWQPEKAHASFEVEPDGQRAWFSGPQDVYASMLGDVEWRPGSGSQTFEIEMEAPVPHATATPTGPGPGQRSGFADRCGSILVGVARPDFPTDVSTEVCDGRKAGWGMFFNEHPFSASASYITSGWYFGDVCVHKCVDEPPIKAGDVLRITLAAGVLTCTRNGRPVEGELKMDGPAVNPAVSAYFTGTAFHLV
jgi:hypothetical protein